MGYCYLIHFDRPIGNVSNRQGMAQHYLGYTSKTLKKRLEQHQKGTGAKITRAAVLQYGRELQLVRYWKGGTRTLERELKRRHRPSYYCPICNP
jgi:putative endonuclease